MRDLGQRGPADAGIDGVNEGRQFDQINCDGGQLSDKLSAHLSNAQRDRFEFPSISKRSCSSPSRSARGEKQVTTCSGGGTAPSKLGSHLLECISRKVIDLRLAQVLLFPDRFAVPAACKFFDNPRGLKSVLRARARPNAVRPASSANRLPTPVWFASSRLR